MTKIKLCGLKRPEDIAAANACRPDVIGFVFAAGSRRYVDPMQALFLKSMLDPSIQSAGVFVNEDLSRIEGLLAKGVIDIVQLHGQEDDVYIQKLKQLTDKPIMKAFSIRTEEDIRKAQESPADLVLLDAGKGGTGTCFDHELARQINRPYFLAGGLDISLLPSVLSELKPYGVDVSSGIETEGVKDANKMKEFVHLVRTLK